MTEENTMSTLPTIVPITDLRLKQSEVLASVAEGPVVVTLFGRPAAVMISPEEYDRIMIALEDLQDAADAAAARRETDSVDLDAYLAGRERVSG
jgi:prevent-host-death family protein